MDEGKGPNPHYEGRHEGESEELRALRLALVSECKELRETLTAVSDALDYLHGMTPQQAADVRKDAARWRYWRNYWSALCRTEVARFARLDLSTIYVQSPGDMDKVTDAAMVAPAAVGAA